MDNYVVDLHDRILLYLHQGKANSYLYLFEKKKLKAGTIFKEGHPAETIVKVASAEGYDMVVIGSRGLGGLKKLFLGSVSNAVVQQIKTNVLVVK